MWWGPVLVFCLQAYHQNLQSQGTWDFGAAIAFMPRISMTSLHSAPKLNSYQFRGKTFCRVLIDGDFFIFNQYPLNLKKTYPLRSMSTFCWQYTYNWRTKSKIQRLMVPRMSYAEDHGSGHEEFRALHDWFRENLVWQKRYAVVARVWVHHINQNQADFGSSDPVVASAYCDPLLQVPQCHQMTHSD